MAADICRRHSEYLRVFFLLITAGVLVHCPYFQETDLPLCRIHELNHKKLVRCMWHPEFYCIMSNKSPSPIRSSATDGLLWLCDKYFLVVLGNRKKVKNRYSDFVMSLA